MFKILFLHKHIMSSVGERYLKSQCFIILLLPKKVTNCVTWLSFIESFFFFLSDKGMLKIKI